MNASKFLVMFLLAVMLAACSTDPYSQIAQGNAALAATSAALISTQQAATLEAQRTQSALGVVATENALAVQATRAAYDNGVKLAIASAVAGEATAHAAGVLRMTQTAYPVAATSTAFYMAGLRREAEAAEWRSKWDAVATPLARVVPVLVWVSVLVLVVLGAVGAYRRLMPVLEMRLRALPRDEGRILYEDGRIVDPARMFEPVLLHSKQGAQAVGGVAVALQAATTAGAQALDALRVRGAARPDHILVPVEDAQPDHMLVPAGAQPDHRPAPAFADALVGWDSATGLPLGVGDEGLVLADPELYPHFLFAGTTGSGKTRFGLRPLAALALASGWQVCIFDPSLLDFLPFQRHPNAHLVKLDEPGLAIAYLMGLYALIRERQGQLASAGVSTWGRLAEAGPRVLAVVDEFSNLADAQERGGQEELWRAARMVAAEGRKAGVHLAIALQDPTHKSIDLRIRRNMSPVAFRVRDSSASRVVLNSDGAELLAPGQFLAGLGLTLIQGAGFAPGDEELGAWLAGLDAPVLPQPTWLDGAGGASGGVVVSEAERIRALRQEGKSISQIAREVFGTNGGAAFYRVKEVLG